MSDKLKAIIGGIFGIGNGLLMLAAAYIGLIFINY